MMRWFSISLRSTGLILGLTFSGWSVGLNAQEDDVGQPLTSTQEEVRRRRVNSLQFDDEWEQLSKNFDSYRSMPLDEREKYRVLHRSIQMRADREELLRLLDRYYEWLEGLTPYERQSIRQAGSVDKKIARIRELHAEDEKEAENEAKSTWDTLSLESASRLKSPSKNETSESQPPAPKSDGKKPITEAEPIFEILEKRMREIGLINEDQAEELHKLPAWDRHRRLVLDYLPNRWNKTNQRIFDKATCEEISKAAEKQTGQSLPGRERIPKMIATVMFYELREEYRLLGSDPAKQREFVEQFRERLPPREQELLEGKPEAEWGNLIQRIYMNRIFKAFARSNEFRHPPGDRRPPVGLERNGSEPRRDVKSEEPAPSPKTEPSPPVPAKGPAGI